MHACINALLGTAVNSAIAYGRTGRGATCMWCCVHPPRHFSYASRKCTAWCENSATPCTLPYQLTLGCQSASSPAAPSPSASPSWPCSSLSARLRHDSDGTMPPLPAGPGSPRYTCVPTLNLKVGGKVMAPSRQPCSRPTRHKVRRAEHSNEHRGEHDPAANPMQPERTKVQYHTVHRAPHSQKYLQG